MKEIIDDLHMVTLPREKVSVQNMLLTGSSALLVNKRYKLQITDLCMLDILYQ